MFQAIWTSLVNSAKLHVDMFSLAALDVLKIALLFTAGKILITVLKRMVARVFHSRAVRMDQRRKETMISLFHNVIRYTIYFVVLLMSLQILSFHIETLLAGAGIAGLAIGFGAQNIIKDVLTGFFILFEDQYGVGDYVNINGATGTVTQVGLRLSRLQVWTGEIESIPNGQIQQVTNYSRTNSIAVIDVGVNYKTELSFAFQVLDRLLSELRNEQDDLLSYNILGVQQFDADAILLRVTAECRPMTHFGVRRLVNLRIKDEFDKAGIDIPVPQRVVQIQNAFPFPTSTQPDTNPNGN